MIEFINICRYVKHDETPIDGVLHVNGKQYWFELMNDDVYGTTTFDGECDYIRQAFYYIYETHEGLIVGLKSRTVDTSALKRMGTSVNLDEINWYH